MTLGEKKEFAAIDYFRIVLAIGVVALHLKPLSGINENIQYFIGNVLTRLCVPCFFLITGFFIESKIDEPQKVKKYILHIVQLYVVYTILYFPQVIFTYLQEGKSFLYIIFGYCRMFFFIGSAIHLWYLVATVVAVCILYVVVRIQGGGKSADIRLAIVAILLYIIGVLGNTYLLEWVQSQHYNVLWLYNILFSTTRNGIFFGFPFVATGYLISKYKKK